MCDAKQTIFESDLQLASDVRNGSIVAFDELFRKYYALLCNLVFPMVKSHDATEDIVQEVFARLWVDRTKWSPEISVRAYLHKAVRNTALNYLKHDQVVTNWSERQAEPSGDDIVEEFDNKELLRALREAIDLLPEGRRTIFLLSRGEGLTYAEIAHVLDVSVKTVETQMGRALKALRGYLSEPVTRLR